MKRHREPPFYRAPTIRRNDNVEWISEESDSSLSSLSNSSSSTSSDSSQSSRSSSRPRPQRRRLPPSSSHISSTDPQGSDSVHPDQTTSDETTRLQTSCPIDPILLALTSTSRERSPSPNGDSNDFPALGYDESGYGGEFAGIDAAEDIEADAEGSGDEEEQVANWEKARVRVSKVVELLARQQRKGTDPRWLQDFNAKTAWFDELLAAEGTVRATWAKGKAKGKGKRRGNFSGNVEMFLR